MNRSTGDVLTQYFEKSIATSSEAPGIRVNCRIAKINYVNRRVQVIARGYSGPMRVPVAAHVKLGSRHKKKAFAGDAAIIELQGDRWICVAIRHKTACLVREKEGVESDIDIGDEPDIPIDLGEEVDIPTADTFSLGDFSDVITPDFPFPPPVELLGDITLPEFELPLPELEHLHCGLPECTDCAPDGYVAGYVLKISTDAEHPGGCWVWGPRGVADFWVLYSTNAPYLTSVSSATLKTLLINSSCISPSSPSTISTLYSGDPIWSANGFETEIVYSSDQGTTWNSVHNSTSRVNPGSVGTKIKFDREDRMLGYLAAAGILLETDLEDILDAFSVSPGDYSQVGSIPWRTNNHNSSAITAIISSDGGATWIEHHLDYLGDVYQNIYVGWITEGAAPCDLGDGIYNFVVGATAYRVCGTVTRVNGAPDVTILPPAPFTYVVAPLENGLGAYFLYGVGGAQIDPGTGFVFNLGVNRIYLVQPDGTQSGVIEISLDEYTDPFTFSEDFIWILETDPLDPDKMYGITLETDTLVQISFSGGLTSLTPPYTPVTDRVEDLLITSLGTILIPVMTSSDEFIMHRSTDQGMSFTQQDLSAHLGSNPASMRMKIGRDSAKIFIVTDAGKVVYSTDDGVTWLASGVILPSLDVLTDLDG